MNNTHQVLYIAGPMRGLPEFNFPEFFRVSSKYERMYWVDKVYNPAQMDLDAGLDPRKMKDEEVTTAMIRQCFARDCDAICNHCTGIVMMKGWERSSGCRAEWALAQTLRLDTYYE